MKLKLLILAGGKGSRLGGKKAITPFLGKPLIYWIFKILREFSFPIYISVKDETQEEEIKKELIKEKIKLDEMVFIKDLYPEIEGPLSGIISALKLFSEKEAFLVLAVDQPLISKNFLNYLELLSYIFCNQFVKVSKDKEKINPFPGVYPCTLKREIETFLLNSPKKSLFRLFQYLIANQSIFFIENEEKIEVETFININTLEDLKRAEICFSQKLMNQKI